ncbi:hypothetical protein FGL01_12290 [Flavobacterium glycines]|uniref:Uncharacterized protein n=1 Tax=Flavobacterium glycines TaxID=551990 RepID=A0A511CCU9_9FLAO|nr:hypothetical protein FGL01_12290 [Flavobacterium glycines]
MDKSKILDYKVSLPIQLDLELQKNQVEQIQFKAIYKSVPSAAIFRHP